MEMTEVGADQVIVAGLTGEMAILETLTPGAMVGEMDIDFLTGPMIK